MKKSKRNEWILILGRWTSKVGDIVFDYVNSVLIVTAYSSNSWMLSLYQSSQVLVNIFLNLIGGVVADNTTRKKIIVFTDILSASICFIASFFVESNYMVHALIISNAILAIVFSFSSPAFKAIVKEMVEQKRIVIYNSVSNIGVEVIAMVGPLIGLILMKSIGGRGALLIDALTFLCSAILEMFLQPISEEPANINEKMNVLKGIVEGFKYLYINKAILFFIVLSALVNFFLAGYNLMLPYTDVIYANRFDNFYSKTLIAEALGGMLGSFINSKISKRHISETRSLLICLGSVGIPIMSIPFLDSSSNLIICLIPFWTFGLLLTVYNINFMSYIQTHVEQNYLGRVFSIIFTVAVMFMPMGSFFFSAVDIISVDDGFGWIGFGIFGTAVIGAIMILIKMYKREEK